MTARHLGVIRLRVSPGLAEQVVDVDLPADAEVLDVLGPDLSPLRYPALLFTASPGEGTSRWRVTCLEIDGGALPARHGRYGGTFAWLDPSKMPVAVFLDRLGHD